METFIKNHIAPAISDATMLAIEISNKVYKPPPYEKAISDPIYGRQ